MSELKPIEIKRLQLDHVLSQDKILFNTNNHWENDEPPKDYKDELESICLKYDAQWREINEVPNTKYNGENFKGWFVRSDRVSLKEGQHGVGPYKDFNIWIENPNIDKKNSTNVSGFKNIIESATSCSPGHTFFEADDSECTIYLFPWLNLNPYKEFRIFVYENEITAISDQHLYKVNEYFNTLSDEEIKTVIYKILDYFEENIKHKLSYLGNYTMDLGFIQDTDTPYFIEPNSFGQLYAADSALFSWIYDTDVLHDSTTIEFRYCHEY